MADLNTILALLKQKEQEAVINSPAYRGGLELSSQRPNVIPGAGIGNLVLRAAPQALGSALMAYGQPKVDEAKQALYSDFTNTLDDSPEELAALLQGQGENAPSPGALLGGTIGSIVNSEQKRELERQSQALNQTLQYQMAKEALNPKLSPYDKELQKLQARQAMGIPLWGRGSGGRGGRGGGSGDGGGELGPNPFQPGSVESEFYERASAIQKAFPNATQNEAIKVGAKLVQPQIASLGETRKRVVEDFGKASQLAETIGTLERGASLIGPEAPGFLTRNIAKAAVLTNAVSPGSYFSNIDTGLSKMRSARADAIKIAREPGSGPVTDRDLEEYTYKLPTGEKPQETKELLNGLKKLQATKLEGAEFTEQYVKMKGTDRGIEPLVNEYRKTYRAIDPETGDVILPNQYPPEHPNYRPAMKDWLQQKEMDEKLSSLTKDQLLQLRNQVGGQ